MSTWYSAQIDRSNSPRSSPRMRISYIWLSLSMYSVFSLFFFFLLWLHAPFLWWLFPYIVAHFLHLSPPPIDFLRNPLNACSIRTSWKLCEEIWAGITLFRCRFSINAANSFWCSAFNVVVIVSFLDISFLVVGPTLLLSLKLIFPKWLTP